MPSALIYFLWHMNHKKRLFVMPSLIALCAVLFAAHSVAESLPTKGKFRGIYQVNRSGVGSLDFFTFSKGLKEQMAPFENKYVEIEVLKARQPMNPGGVVIDQVGSVTRLPDPPLELRLSALPSNQAANDRLDFMCTVTNRTDREITFDARTLRMGTRGYPHIASEARRLDFSNSGYTLRQLDFGGEMAQPLTFLTPLEPGEKTCYYPHIALRPGEAVPFVVHGMRREPGEYELAATASYCAGDKCLPAAAALPIDFPLEHERPRPAQPLKVEARLVYDDEWLVAEGVISDPAEMGVSIFTRQGGGLHLLPGLVQMRTASDEFLEPDLDWTEPDGPWRRSLLDGEGLHFTFRIRNKDRFSRADIAKVGLWTVTNRGVERLVLSSGIAARARPISSPWGASTHGCRMRIETPKTTFAAGDRIRFFVQAESDGSAADVLWVNKDKFWSQVLATVDGQNAKIERGGVSDAILYKFPFQVDVGLAAIKDLARGKHVLQFSVQADPGVYGEQLRKLGGKLVSNVVEFEIR